MKKIIFTILFAALSQLAFSQDKETSLKKDIISADIGLFTVWINYERHLGGLFTLKSQLGLGFGWGQDFFSNGSYYTFIPIAIAEPRYYYNFNRRVEKGKKTSYNASNYFALAPMYFFKPFIISNNPYEEEYQSTAALIPKWGMKRTIGRRWNFEFGLGPGVSFSNAETNATYWIDLRFGYNIK